VSLSTNVPSPSTSVIDLASAVLHQTNNLIEEMIEKSQQPVDYSEAITLARSILSRVDTIMSALSSVKNDSVQCAPLTMFQNMSSLDLALVILNKTDGLVTATDQNVKHVESFNMKDQQQQLQLAENILDRVSLLCQQFGSDMSTPAIADKRIDADGNQNATSLLLHILSKTNGLVALTDEISVGTRVTGPQSTSIKLANEILTRVIALSPTGSGLGKSLEIPLKETQPISSLDLASAILAKTDRMLGIK
jgi:hypothetical protein